MILMTIKSGKDDVEYLKDTLASKPKPKPNIKVKPKVKSEEAKEKEEEEYEENNDELKLAEEIVQVYDLKETPEDVIEYLKSIDGKKDMKYQIANDHYAMKKLTSERDHYKHLAEVFFASPPNGIPASVSASASATHQERDSGSSDSGSAVDEDIKYHREVASAWGPFLLMRDQLNPPANSGNSGEDEGSAPKIVNAINQQSAAIASLASQMGGGHMFEQAKSVIDLVKSVKEVLMESETDKRQVLEEETKRRQIAANESKVAQLVELVKNSGDSPPSPSPSPEHRSRYESGSEEREEIDSYGCAPQQCRSISEDDRKFDEMFGSSRRNVVSGSLHDSRRRQR